MTMLALLCMTVASAQQTVTSSRQPRQFDATTQTSLMAEKLGLSSDQKTKVEALNKEYAELFTRPQMRRATQGGSSTGERPELTDEQKAQMKANMEARRTKREEYNTKLKSILTGHFRAGAAMDNYSVAAHCVYRRCGLQNVVYGVITFFLFDA